MKITKQQLRNIIFEEINKELSEQDVDEGFNGTVAAITLPILAALFPSKGEARPKPSSFGQPVAAQSSQADTNFASKFIKQLKQDFKNDGPLNKEPVDRLISTIAGLDETEIETAINNLPPDVAPRVMNSFKFSQGDLVAHASRSGGGIQSSSLRETNRK